MENSIVIYTPKNKTQFKKVQTVLLRKQLFVWGGILYSAFRNVRYTCEGSPIHHIKIDMINKIIYPIFSQTFAGMDSMVFVNEDYFLKVKDTYIFEKPTI